MRSPPRIAALALTSMLLGCWDLRSADDRRDASPEASPQDTGAVDVAAPDQPTGDTVDAPNDTPADRVAVEVGVDAAMEASAADAPADAVSDATDVLDVADVGVDRSDAAPEAALDVAPDRATDAVDAAPEAALDAALDRPIDAAPDVAPDVAPDIAPDVAPDVVVPTVPRPILPPSGGRVLRNLPTFEVEAPAGADAVLVELCGTANCASPLRSLTLQRTASRVRGRLTGDALPDGRYWWRAHAMAGSTRVSTSATWRFRLTARAGAADAVGPEPLDVDNNGVNDFVAVCDGRTQLYLGGMYLAPTSLGPTGVTLRGRLTATGDFNGDGFGDVAAVAPNGAPDARVVHVYLGRATGLSPTPWTMPFTADAEVRWLGAAGDFNRDGFSDLVVDRVAASAPVRQVTVVYGGPTALRMGPSLTDLAPATGTGATPFVGAANVGDYDNDGYEDLAVGVPGPVGGEYERFARVFSNGRFGAGEAVAVYAFPGTPRCGGDMNGDGTFDIIAHQSGAAAMIIGSPAAITPLTMPAQTQIAAGDFHNDAIDDIFFGGLLGAGNPFVGTFLGRTATGFRAGGSAIVTAESRPEDLVDAVQWGLYDGDTNADALIHLEETVGGVRRGSFRVYRSVGGTIYTTPIGLTLLNCTNLIAW